MITDKIIQTIIKLNVKLVFWLNGQMAVRCNGKTYHWLYVSL